LCNKAVPPHEIIGAFLIHNRKSTCGKNQRSLSQWLSGD
jgi:hypothetical protein